ncbi:Leucine zipper transcription factor-like protein 1 [Blattella germanica]|nr:Leucine zipper transcription factor-like protein 1 [Blattella germanica]
MIIMNYMKFARYQRNQNLKAIEYAFKDVLDSRLLEDTYTSEEVQELLTGLSQVVRGDIETELISSSHMTILLLKQLFEQAEKWHLRLQADLSELENREQLEVIKALETNEFYVKPEKNPPTPTKIKLEPVSDGSARLLNLEIERLNEENEKLNASLKESESKITLYLQEISKLKLDLGEAQSEVVELREQTVKPPETSQLDEMETQLSEVRNLLATNLELSVSNQQQLETELSTTREKVAEVQAQLSLAEQELERKFSQTAAYANMKKILNKKNDQIKELRKKLQQYEPDEKGEE